ncbi:nitroreductase [Pseudodesulfovibrio sp. F-1]|uniref:Nitroreductase n=1 Tax=Pseudodesulfovibrio alkaliphilus TaxID=2661613 RepID=A0A7K1KMB8_9BACT|nr:nitroreductase family protein [Pseudodesulfovibrio alkaliphilus]MUM77157.1 nitroreductase [Pseudodesulfovibrio alkaliphilus]
MPLFTVDADACARDGLCAAVCPVGCIVGAPDQLPVPHEKKQAYCLECGHCVAVCPRGALRLDRFASGPVRLDRADRPSLDQVEWLLRARRSMRTFRPEPPDRRLVARLLDLTQYAPSGHNARPVEWVVAATPEAVRVVATAVAQWMRDEAERQTPLAAALHLAGVAAAFDAGVDIICRDAPMLAVAHTPAQGITPAEDGVIAVTYLELAAAGAGLGACWCGYLCAAARHDPRVTETLGLDESRVVRGALLLGRPARRYAAAPPRPAARTEWL